jgi:hypothetical protein
MRMPFLRPVLFVLFPLLLVTLLPGPLLAAKFMVRTDPKTYNIQCYRVKNVKVRFRTKQNTDKLYSWNLQVWYQAPNTSTWTYVPGLSQYTLLSNTSNPYVYGFDAVWTPTNPAGLRQGGKIGFKVPSSWDVDGYPFYFENVYIAPNNTASSSCWVAAQRTADYDLGYCVINEADTAATVHLVLYGDQDACGDYVQIIDCLANASPLDSIDVILAAGEEYCGTVFNVPIADKYAGVVACSIVNTAEPLYADTLAWYEHYGLIEPIVGVETGPEVGFALDAVAPNPSTRGSAIVFHLPRAAPVRLTVLDVAGREVACLADGWQAAGRHEVVWTAAAGAAAVGPGRYFVRLESAGRTLAREVTILR